MELPAEMQELVLALSASLPELETDDDGIALLGIDTMNQLLAAQNYLQQAAENNLPEHLESLSYVLNHGGVSQAARMAAGLQLKNHLVAKHQAEKNPKNREGIKVVYPQRWRSLPEETRTCIKKNIVGALGTGNMVPISVAQCVACVAAIEVPVGQWPEVITILTANVKGSNSAEKKASLEAIGYICRDIGEYVLSPEQSNKILTAIIMHGMRSTETNYHLRLAATTALLRSLKFTRTGGHFESEFGRNIIMEVVCETAHSKDTQVRVAAIQCLIEIMKLHYQLMEPYMGALLPITLEAMQSDENEVVRQGIQFWTEVSKKEDALEAVYQDAVDRDLERFPTPTSRCYTEMALKHVVPVILSKLTEQEELVNGEAWSTSEAAFRCLESFAFCCRDRMERFLLPFVRQNIKSTDWRCRAAALLALAADVHVTTLTNEVGITTLIELMYDTSVLVRVTAGSVLSCICDDDSDALTNETHFKPFLEALLSGFKREPRVAANVCEIFAVLTRSAYEQTYYDVHRTNGPQTYVLSQYFECIVDKLLETIDRVDSSQDNLRAAAYEALKTMIYYSAKDCYNIVQKTAKIIIERLNLYLTFELQIKNPIDIDQCHELHDVLATLEYLLRKMTLQDALQLSDPVMSALLQTLSFKSDKFGSQAVKAVLNLVEVLGAGFNKYMSALKPYLKMGLKNHAFHKVCDASVSLTGGIFRVLGTKTLPFCDEIITLLLEILLSQTAEWYTKIHVLYVFPDISRSIGPKFKNCLDAIIPALHQASQIRADQVKGIDALIDFRAAIFQTYYRIIQDLKGNDDSPDLAFVEPHIHKIVEFINLVASENLRQGTRIIACNRLIGNLCSTFGPKVIALLDTEPVQALLDQGRLVQDSHVYRMLHNSVLHASDTRNVSIWAMEMLHSARSRLSDRV